MFEEDGHRPGDWLHRDLRERAADERHEEEAAEEAENPWYRDTFWIVFFLVLFWPAGLYLMWRSGWKLPVKIIITIIVAAIVIFVYAMITAYQQLT